MANSVPTVNDLRVKLCYICREEERYDDAKTTDPPRAWTHPCNCTLVAHEQCLLKWIQTSQGTSVRAANALKCPQCGAKYEVQSQYPVLLRFLAAGNKALQKLGRLFTVFGVATFIGVIGSGIYIICAGYGAWALRKFIGDEMFDILLSNDPANWPWTAYFNLPLIPLSLIISRMQSSFTVPAIMPVLLVWPASSPVGRWGDLLREYWTDPNNARRLTLTTLPPMRAWPPSPLAFGAFFVPLAKTIYRILYARLAFRVLGANATSLMSEARQPNGAPIRDGRLENHVNVAIVGDDHEGGRGENGEAERREENANQGRQQGQGNVQRRVIWQWNGLALRIRAHLRDVPEPRPQRQPRPRQNRGNGQIGDANARERRQEVVGEPRNNDNEANNQPENPEANADADGNPVEDVVQAAEQQIEVNTTSLGRQIGGALLIPAISSWMGSLLLRLSRHSNLLRRFLGIKLSALSKLDGRITWGARATENGFPRGLLLFPLPPLGPWSYGGWERLSTGESIALGLKLGMNAMWGGTRTWAESDPVWWRNSVGLGLFVVAKDCLQLLHLWLTKRELETRRVKNKDFSGVDLNELDLIPTWVRHD
ncbi:hypothetical protein APHAL10511_002857 [Amanita phalloides]|nr:hypothetical protein APHAL10511_002857 [Amanita phalloides]